MQHKWEGHVLSIFRESNRQVRYHYSLRLRTPLGYRERYTKLNGLTTRRVSEYVRTSVYVYALLFRTLDLETRKTR